MSRSYGSQGIVKPLRKVLVKRPDEAFVMEDPARCHYTDRPNLEVAQREHDALVDIQRQVLLQHA